MDPSICGKLLTTHRRGKDVDVEALHGRFPLRQSVGEGSKMGSRGYRRLRQWKLCFAVLLDVFGFVGIYRSKKYIGGYPRVPQDRGAWPPISWAPRAATDVLLPPIYTYVPRKHPGAP